MRNTEMELERDAIEVWRPDDLPELELQRGANVSRTVPRHWHEEYQLCLIQSGIGELNYRGNHLTTPAASLFIVHPGEVHANRCYDRFGVAYRSILVSVELMRRVTEHHGKRQDIPFFPVAVVFDEDVIARYLNFCLALENSSSRLEREVLLLDLTLMMANMRAVKPYFAEAFRSAPWLIRHWTTCISPSLACIHQCSLTVLVS